MQTPTSPRVQQGIRFEYHSPIYCQNPLMLCKLPQIHESSKASGLNIILQYIAMFNILHPVEVLVYQANNQILQYSVHCNVQCIAIFKLQYHSPTSYSICFWLPQNSKLCFLLNSYIILSSNNKSKIKSK